jgi:hypothetical protein
MTNENATTGGSGDPLAKLSAAGVSIWLDDLSRERLETGNLAELVKQRHVVGVSTSRLRSAPVLSVTTARVYTPSPARLIRRTSPKPVLRSKSGTDVSSCSS